MPSSIQSFVYSILPNQKPLAWSILYGLVVLYSLYLFVLASIAADDPDNDPDKREYIVLAQTEYIVYDFFTTLLWLLSVGGRMNNNVINWPQRIELLLALIFLIESGRVLWEWKFQNEEIEALWWTMLLNSAAYSYELYLSIHRYREIGRGYDSIRECDEVFDLVV